MNNLLFKPLILGLLVLVVGMTPIFAFAESNDVGSETITIHSTPLEIPDKSTIQSMSFHNPPPPCILPSSVYVQVPNTVQVGQTFDVTITPSFELTSQQLDEYNESYRTAFDNARELWDAVCYDYWRYYNISHPATYEFSGDSVSYSGHRILEHYFPPYEVHYSVIRELNFNNDPITFQTTINEPIIYLTSDIGDLENMDYLKYDFGTFIIKPTTTHVYRTIPPISIHTTIDNGIITLSELDSARSQTIVKWDDANPNDQLIPYYEPTIYHPVLPHLKSTLTTAKSIDIITRDSFELIDQVLKQESNNHYTAETLIVALGLDEEFLEEFLEAYPQHSTRTQSSNSDPDWNLPPSDEQSVRRVSVVDGVVTFFNSQDIQIPVRSVNVCAINTTSDGSPISLPDGMAPPCDVSNQMGEFEIIVPLTDFNGNPIHSTIKLQANFENDDFRIIQYDLDENDRIDRTSTSIHSVMSDEYRDISGILYHYGAFELPPAVDSSRASYILNFLQPVHDWYMGVVGYNPEQAKINWTPNFCKGPFVHPTTNIMSVPETTIVTTDGIMPCEHVLSPLESPSTLRHEYAHQVQNQVYLDSREDPFDVSDCGDYNFDGVHSPVHSSGPKCAWTEGWAFFMATTYDDHDDPVYQPSYMAGQWNFETRENTETSDLRFANKIFINGNQEGNVASGLYDIVDATNEIGDDLFEPISHVWDAFTFSNPLPRTINDFKTNWDSLRYPSLDDIFELNTLHTLDGVSHPPSNLEEINIGHNFVTLSWDKSNDTSITEYIVYHRPSGQNEFNVFTNDPDELTSPSHTIMNLSPSTIYIFQVSAVNIHGESSKSEEFQITMPRDLTITTPAKPTNLIATPTHNSITLEWDALVGESITGYKILSRTTGQTELSVLIPNTNSYEPTYVIEDLLPDTLYVFRVVTLNGSVESPHSNFVRLSTLPAPIITAPTITAPDDITLEATGVFTYVDIGTATIPDNSGLDISNDNPETFRLGTTLVTWTATNSVGDTVEATQNIIIVDTLAPIFDPHSNGTITFSSR